MWLDSRIQATNNYYHQGFGMQQMIVRTFGKAHIEGSRGLAGMENAFKDPPYAAALLAIVAARQLINFFLFSCSYILP